MIDALRKITTDVAGLLVGEAYQDWVGGIILGMFIILLLAVFFSSRSE